MKDGKALLISKYALDSQDYNKGYEDTTWETCTLRKWLNNDFLNAAFTNEEKEFIPTVTVSATKNPHYKTKAGKSTKYKVFLLSITEAEEYFTSNAERSCVPTAYAIEQGAYTYERYTKDGKATCYCWVRSPGYDQSYATIVHCDGSIDEDVVMIYYEKDSAVRPALWIDLNS